LLQQQQERLAERLEVVGFARGDDVAVLRDLLIDPVRSRIDEISRSAVCVYLPKWLP